MPARPWGPADRTGGPVDGLFDQLRERIDGLMVERLEVTHAADDDNVWFLRATRSPAEDQIDTWPHGQTPFYIEADQGPVRTSRHGRGGRPHSHLAGTSAPRLTTAERVAVLRDEPRRARSDRPTRRAPPRGRSQINPS